ncbi:MAG: DinB family protein [Blastocatellia bacterium]
MVNGGELVAELTEYYRQVEEINRDAENLIEGLSDAQFNWRPAENIWSVGDCLEHLNITSRLYFPVIAEAITRSRTSGVMSPGPYKHGWLGNRIVRSTEPPVKTRFKAPPKFRPLANHPLTQAWSQFVAFQDQLLKLIREANGVDLARTKVPLPATNLVKLTLGQGFGLIAAHERRHLWQARRVKEDPNFPMKIQPR